MDFPGTGLEVETFAQAGPAYFYYGGVKIDLDSTATAISLLMQAKELAQSGRYELASVTKDGRRLDFLLGPGIPLMVRYPTDSEGN